MKFNPFRVLLLTGLCIAYIMWWSGKNDREFAAEYAAAKDPSSTMTQARREQVLRAYESGLPLLPKK